MGSEARARQPDISVVVCTRDRAASLERTLKCLVAQDLDPDRYEIVVVDNGSTDRTADVVRSAAQGPVDIRTHFEPEPGLSRARNHGIRRSRAPVVAFTDDDAGPDEGWLPALLSAFTGDRVDAAGGPIRAVWPRHRPSWLPARLAGFYAELDLGSAPRRFVFPEFPYGVNMALRRDALDAVGAFDVGLGRDGRSVLGHDEADLFARLAARDARVEYVPQAVVHHHIEADRVTRRWLIRRSYSQGRSRARFRDRLVGGRSRWRWGISVPHAIVRGVLAVWRGGFGPEREPRLEARAVHVVAAAAQAAGYTREAISLTIGRRGRGARGDVVDAPFRGPVAPRIRVLLVDGSDRGGIANYTRRLADALDRAGADARVTAPGVLARQAPPIPAARWGDRLGEIGRFRLYAIRASEVVRRTAAFARALYDVRPDLIHVQTEIARRLDPPLFRVARRRVPVILTVHDPIALEGGEREARRQHRRWRSADALIVHSERARGIVAAAAPGVPVHVVRVDAPPRAGLSRDEGRRRLGLGADDPVVLALGILRPAKGLGFLAEVWRLVADAAPDAVLHVVGSVPRNFPELDDLARVPGVQMRLGWLSDDELSAWAAAADVMVLPYSQGSHSAILHEAATHGTRVLASPPLAEEVERLGNGRSIAMDEARWASAIADELEAARESGRPRTASAGGEGMATRTLDVYEAVLAALS